MNELTWRRGALWIKITIPRDSDRLPHRRDSSFTASQGSSYLCLNLMVVLICPPNLITWRSQLFEPTLSQENVFCTFWMPLFFPPLFPLSLMPNKVPHYPLPRTFPLSGLWVRPLPTGNSCLPFSANRHVSLGTMLKSALLWQEAFLAFCYSDRSLSQVGLGFGCRVPSVPFPD